MKKFYTLFLFLLTIKIAIASGGAGTKFQMYVPPTNENMNRPICLIITSFSDSTTFSLLTIIPAVITMTHFRVCFQEGSHMSAI